MHHLKHILKSKSLIWIIVLVVVILLAIFIANRQEISSDNSFKETSNDKGASLSSQSASQEPAQDTKKSGESIDWRNIELKDIKTDKIFKISDFKEKPVLLESFAVWCPKCTQLQKEIRELRIELKDSFIPISVDTDANENEDLVEQHIERNGFDWTYAVAPSGFTKSLINEFGLSIINAPSEPVVIICPNGKTTFLGTGSKSSMNLKEGIENC